MKDILFLFRDIRFDDKSHTYRSVKNKKKKFISATGYKKKFMKPFDTGYWSKYKALKNAGVRVWPALTEAKLAELVKRNNLGGAVQSLIQDWVYKGEVASGEGSGTHDVLQHIAHRRYNIRGEHKPNDYKVLSGEEWLEDNPHLIPIFTEWVIGSEELGISGMIDLFLYNTKTQGYEIWDWKTDAKIELTNKYNKLAPPYEEYDDCKHNGYMLQLNFYRYILEQSGVKVSRMGIVYLGEEQYTEHVLPKVNIYKEYL